MRAGGRASDRRMARGEEEIMEEAILRKPDLASQRHWSRMEKARPPPIPSRPASPRPAHPSAHRSPFATLLRCCHSRFPSLCTFS